MTGPAWKRPQPPLSTTCPNDDQPLELVEGTPSTPPWWCASCSRLWWPAQLEPAAVEAWDNAAGGYPPSPALEAMQGRMQGQAEERRAAARERRRSS